METDKTPVQTPQQKAQLRKQLINFFLFLGFTVGIALWMMIAEIWPAISL